MILRLSLENLTNYDKDTPEKIERKVKRIKALRLALKNAPITIYYGDGFLEDAQKVSNLFKDTTIKPLSTLLNKDNDIMVIILDSPSNLAKDLFQNTCKKVSFSKSKGVLTSLSDSGKENILWELSSKDWIYFAYPNEKISKPRKSEISLRDIIKPKINKSSRIIKKNLELYIKNPKDVESVHKYRVSLRSFRALISMVKPVIKPKSYVVIQDIFRDKAKDCARLRELDVLINQWENIRQQSQNNLLQALKRERKIEQEKLSRILKNSRTKKEITSGINLLTYELKNSNWKEIDGIELLDKNLNSWYSYALESLWEMEEFNFSYVHKIRIKSKKYRYIAEYFSDYITNSQSKRYELAKNRQKVLGEITDAIRNQEAMRELFPILSVNALNEAKQFISKEKQREKELLASINLKKIDNM